MSRVIKPVCNGCNLQIGQQKVHGDLWGNTGLTVWVFVPVLRAHAAANDRTVMVPAWNAPGTDGPLLVTLEPGEDYWERNNIFILPWDGCICSPELEAYLTRTL
jgi:hypothetical protein